MNQIPQNVNEGITKEAKETPKIYAKQKYKKIFDFDIKIPPLKHM